MSENLLHERRAGILLHPTSLPSGHLDDAEKWLDWMSGCKASIWQMLPLTIPDAYGSPYQSSSAFALNYDLLGSDSINTAETIDKSGLQSFIDRQHHWLGDFALFCVLKAEHQQLPWYEWPETFKTRDDDAISAFALDHQEAIDKVYLQQFAIYQRWQQVKNYANQQGIYLFGDMPIFVAYDSADVWANPEQFLLDENLQPTFVAGVPPDYFSETGQRWGNPHYNWNHMLEEGFDWWKRRMQHAFECFDIIRIDHFRGLEACWMIPAEAETAIEGSWQETPGDAMLEQIFKTFDNPAIVAEDLGVITPEVMALRDKYDLPGMSILQFAFDGFDDNPHKPKNITPSNVVYTGTHDNDTTAGWFEKLQEHEKAFVFKILQTAHRNDIAHCLIETAMYSQANTAIVPLQDLLQLTSESRMNTPGEKQGNWLWQFQWQQLNEHDCHFFSEHIEKSGRSHATHA